MEESYINTVVPLYKGYPSGVSSPDPTETKEWLEALEDVLRHSGPARCNELIQQLLRHAQSRGAHVRPILNTPYCNTIHPSNQPPYPGDLKIEQRLTAILRWNALAMVVRANSESSELGGHLASYASAADLFEVGFNHFFRGNRDESSLDREADLVFFQPHSAPGVYARAFLEGRLTEENLA